MPVWCIHLLQVHKCDKIDTWVDCPITSAYFKYIQQHNVIYRFCSTKIETWTVKQINENTNKYTDLNSQVIQELGTIL